MRLNGFSKWIRKVEGYKEPQFEYDKDYHGIEKWHTFSSTDFISYLKGEIGYHVNNMFSWRESPDGYGYWSRDTTLRLRDQTPEKKKKILGFAVGIYGEDFVKDCLYEAEWF